MSRSISQSGSTKVELSQSPQPVQVKKARMLVAMLGADFAKSSPHPFFKDLARTAVQPLDKKAPPPDLSRALANLVRKLAEPQIRRPSSKIKDQKTLSVDVASDPPGDALVEPKGDIMAQHPALIAKHLLELSSAERLNALRHLPGKTARQVASYISELNA